MRYFINDLDLEDKAEKIWHFVTLDRQDN